MDLATISGAYTGIKIVKESLSTAFQYKVDKQAEIKINEALEKLGAIQDSLFEMREELFRLQDENRRLKDEISAQKNWETRISNYELVETSGGAVVYVSKNTPQHYACPSCTEKKEIQILQNQHTHLGSFKCPGCNKTFPINPVKHFQHIPSSRGWT